MESYARRRGHETGHNIGDWQGETMSLEINYKDEEGYLLVTVSGQWNLPELKVVVAQIRDEAAQRRQTRALVDARSMEGQPSEMDRYHFGIYAAELWGGRLKVAILYQEQFINKLAENTAVNRGAKVIVVSEREEALRWLLA